MGKKNKKINSPLLRTGCVYYNSTLGEYYAQAHSESGNGENVVETAGGHHQSYDALLLAKSFLFEVQQRRQDYRRADRAQDAPAGAYDGIIGFRVWLGRMAFFLILFSPLRELLNRTTFQESHD